MRPIFAALALVGLAGPALACINDAELPKYEREFRSQYRGAGAPPESPSTPVNQYLMIGGGAALLMGAAVVTVTIGRRAR